MAAVVSISRGEITPGKVVQERRLSCLSPPPAAEPQPAPEASHEAGLDSPLLLPLLGAPEPWPASSHHIHRV